MPQPAFSDTHLDVSDTDLLHLSQSLDFAAPSHTSSAYELLPGWSPQNLDDILTNGSACRDSDHSESYIQAISNPCSDARECIHEEPMFYQHADLDTPGMDTYGLGMELPSSLVDEL